MSHRNLGAERLSKWQKTMSAQTLSVPILVGDDDDWQVGKKEALHRLVRSAKTSYVLLTDGDVSVSSRWVEAVMDSAWGTDLLMLPVRMSVDSGVRGWQALWQRAQALEFASLVGSGMAMCGLGHPIMCNGAGLLVKTDKWLESWDDLHPELPSGDDVFLLHSFKRRGLTVRYATAPDTAVCTTPSHSLSDFWRQRTRWASKATAYTDRDTIAVAAFVALTNVLWLATLLQPLCFIAFWLVKSLADYSFFRRITLLYKAGHTLPLTLFINLLYPFYAILTPLAALLRKKQW